MESLLQSRQAAFVTGTPSLSCSSQVRYYSKLSVPATTFHATRSQRSQIVMLDGLYGSTVHLHSNSLRGSWPRTESTVMYGKKMNKKNTSGKQSKSMFELGDLDEEKIEELAQVSQPQSTSSSSSSKQSTLSVSQLKAKVRDLVADTDMGLIFGEDGTEEEDEIESVLEQLEDINQEKKPARSNKLVGTWDLVYTSASLTRYFKGMTAMHKFLPSGKCTQIVLTIGDLESTESELVEKICAFGNAVKFDVKVNSRWRAKTDSMFSLEHDRIQIGFYKGFADSWKPIRAFNLFDVTYLDGDLMLSRGQTGSIQMWQRME